MSAPRVAEWKWPSVEELLAAMAARARAVDEARRHMVAVYDTRPEAKALPVERGYWTVRAQP